MKRHLYNLHLWWNDQLTNLKGKYFKISLIALGILGVVLVIALSMQALSRDLAEKERIKRQEQMMSRKRDELKELQSQTFATEKAKIADGVWEDLSNSPDYTTAQRYATAIVNVVDEKSRQSAMRTLPFAQDDVAGRLALEMPNDPYFSEPKSLELISWGRTYGKGLETYTFVYNTIWNSPETDEYYVREVVKFTLENGKIIEWNHIFGKR